LYGVSVMDGVTVPKISWAQFQASHAPELQHQPPIWYPDEPKEKERAREQRRSPRPWPQLLAACVGIGCCVFILLLAVIFFSSARQKISINPHNTHAPHSQLQYISSPHIAQFQSQNIEIFYYDFVSGTEIQNFQRHPANGPLPDINITQLVDYRVCCTSNTHKFVCSTGNNFLEHGLALDAVIELDEYSESVFLLLWINNEDLVEVGCVLSGSIRKSPG